MPAHLSLIGDGRTFQFVLSRFVARGIAVTFSVQKSKAYAFDNDVKLSPAQAASLPEVKVPPVPAPSVAAARGAPQGERKSARQAASRAPDGQSMPKVVQTAESVGEMTAETREFLRAFYRATSCGLKSKFQLIFESGKAYLARKTIGDVVVTAHTVFSRRERSCTFECHVKKGTADEKRAVVKVHTGNDETPVASLEKEKAMWLSLTGVGDIKTVPKCVTGTFLDGLAHVLVMEAGWVSLSALNICPAKVSNLVDVLDRDIKSSLEAMHKLKLMHGDVHPANIVARFNEDGDCEKMALIDFEGVVEFGTKARDSPAHKLNEPKKDLSVPMGANRVGCREFDQTFYAAVIAWVEKEGTKDFGKGLAQRDVDKIWGAVAARANADADEDEDEMKSAIEEDEDDLISAESESAE
jgi:hypothetical protein